MAYITKKTASQIVLESQQSWGGVLFILIFSGAALFMAIALISALGTTTLSCQRIEPDRVNCEKSQSKYFGLVKQKPEPLGQVTQAEFKSKIEEDEDGDTV
ncbi:MAG: hypothetical protein SVX43_07680 [Cyanobacteriota bacterium]|nr:hypothetical protein [Cyanobacteriota bacterium]